MVAEVDAGCRRAGRTTRVEVAAEVWAENLPRTEQELALQGLAFFTYRAGPARRRRDRSTRLPRRAGREPASLVPEPIVYEDFLPRSAAGIFQSNLTDEGSRDDELARHAVRHRHGWRRSSASPIADPNDLYAAQQAASLAGPRPRWPAITISSLPPPRPIRHQENASA